MKKVKLFDAYQESKNETSVNESCGTCNETSCVCEVNEANADGTISDDEDERRDQLEMEIYQQTETLINFLKEEAESIGGSFRSPGIIADCVKQIKDAFRKNKIKL